MPYPHGDPLVLEDLRRTFTSDPIRVAEIEVPPNRRVTAILAREFDGVPSGAQVNEKASRLIGQMNGILFAMDPDRPPVRMGVGIFERESGGAWGSGANYASVSASLEIRFRAYCVGDRARWLT
jgi:hypothetical protein